MGHQVPDRQLCGRVRTDRRRRIFSECLKDNVHRRQPSKEVHLRLQSNHDWPETGTEIWYDTFVILQMSGAMHIMKIYSMWWIACVSLTALNCNADFLFIAPHSNNYNVCRFQFTESEVPLVGGANSSSSLRWSLGLTGALVLLYTVTWAALTHSPWLDFRMKPREVTSMLSYMLVRALITEVS